MAHEVGLNEYVLGALFGARGEVLCGQFLGHFARQVGVGVDESTAVVADLWGSRGGWVDGWGVAEGEWVSGVVW